MKRRDFLATTAAASALAALSPALATRAQAEEAVDVEAAKKEGQVSWYTAHFDTQTAEGVGNAFMKQYPGIKASVFRSTAQVIYQRLSQDARADVAECDVFSSTDVGHYVHLKPTGVFVKWTPPTAAHIVDALKGLDPDGEYFVTSAGLICITYNRNKVKESELPKSWPDLLDPKWKDQVSVGHPGFSGYVGTWVVEMRKLYGWQYFEKLKANSPQIGRSINDTVTMLNSGERTVAAGPAALTLESASKGNPLGVVYPSDGALLMVSPSAIMKNSRRPNAAKLFMNFLMSPEASKVYAEHFQDPVVPDVPPAAGAKSIAEVKTIRPTVEEITKGIPEVIKAWRETFGV
jgi:iron(III) transport system substrate-binding protein